MLQSSGQYDPILKVIKVILCYMYVVPGGEVSNRRGIKSVDMIISFIMKYMYM